MKRIVFLDYLRVFACFLVMVVHASENFYGAAGSTDMAGPQSYLASEADRLWVSVYDGLSRMSVPLFIIVSAYLLVPMKEDVTPWQYYRRRFKRILPPFIVFMILYSTLPLLWGADKCGNLCQRFVAYSAELPHTCRTPVVHVSPYQHLPVYAGHLAVAA